MKLEASKLTTVPELKDFLKKLLAEVGVGSRRSSLCKSQCSGVVAILLRSMASTARFRLSAAVETE